MTLKLLATDTDDLQIVASALQDSILRLGDVHYDRIARSVSIRLSRFRHEQNASERIVCGLRVDGVMSLKTVGIDQMTPDSFLVILDVVFEEADKPAGYLDIILAGGSVLRLSVEGLDLMLADIGETRKTRSRPDHDDKE